MKNLYKIEDELYIISNTENVDENCWIITDGKLVQVSYLLSDEVAKGNKVILTTNKLLIKDGVQAIDDEFIEWFVKNPSCEEVEIYRSGNHYDGAMEFYEPSFYSTIIPKQEIKRKIDTCYNFDMEIGCIQDICRCEQEEFGTKEFNDLANQYLSGKHKQETLEEASSTVDKIDGIIFDLSIEDKVKLFDLIETYVKEEQQRSYSEEDMNEYADYCWSFSNDNRYKSPLSPKEWFEQFKKK